MDYSENAIEIVKKYTPLLLQSKRNIERDLVVGYNHKGAEVKANMEITEQQALEWLKEDLSNVAKIIYSTIKNHTKVKVKQWEFDALVVFAFHQGTKTLTNSKIFKFLKEERRLDAAEEFLNWGIVLGKSGKMKQDQAELRRRAFEKKVFLGKAKDLNYAK